jgi:hypothetical protein
LQEKKYEKPKQQKEKRLREERSKRDRGNKEGTKETSGRKGDKIAEKPLFWVGY